MTGRLPADPAGPDPARVPPPWTCRLRAVVRPSLVGGTDGRRLAVLAVVAYADTPVGAYGEALLAELRLPARLHVPWIVVDSAASARAGRAHWGLPKELAQLDLDLPASGRVVAPEPVGEVRVSARPVGPRVPVAGRAVLDQPGRGAARLRFTGRARPALVRVVGGPAPGRGPGLEIEGVLRLAAPRPSG